VTGRGWTKGEMQAVRDNLMTIDEDGRRRCRHDRPIYDWCVECYATLTPDQLRLMGKSRTADQKENRVR
jgi:hypothetical protein